VGQLGGAVGPLRAHRIVDRDRVAEPEDGAPRGEEGDGPADDAGEGAGAPGEIVDHACAGERLALPGREFRHHGTRDSQGLLGAAHGAEAIQAGAGDSLEDDAEAGFAPAAEKRDPEDLAQARRDRELGRMVEGDAGPRLDAAESHGDEVALRPGEDASRVVARKDAAQGCFAGGHEDGVVRSGELVEVGDRGSPEMKTAAPSLEFAHSGRHLEAVIDGAARSVELALHGQEEIARLDAEVDVDPVDEGRLVGPEVEPELALVGESGGEQPGGHGEAALEQLVGRAVRHEGDGAPLLQQSKAELQSGLAGSHDGDGPHLWVRIRGPEGKVVMRDPGSKG